MSNLELNRQHNYSILVSTQHLQLSAFQCIIDTENLIDSLHSHSFKLPANLGP